MFSIFKKKTPLEKLQDQYKKLMAEAHGLSQKDRKAADTKYAESEIVAKEIEKLSRK
ncbi:MAG: Lacal_2735 family protein [Bacteroidota bacterium]|nr:Lacal_2735 family protein [Bacteroidota bacterium]